MRRAPAIPPPDFRQRDRGFLEKPSYFKASRLACRVLLR
jgi:hypothetical protein